MDHFERVPLKDLRIIQRGPLVYSKFSFSGLVAGGSKANQFGIRIHTGDPRSSTPFSKDQVFRTYCATVPEDSRPGTAEVIIADIIDSIEAARNDVLVRGDGKVRADGFEVRDLPIERANYLGPISYVSNALKLGFFAKKGGSE